MRVFNPGDHGVFVNDHGVVPAGEEATVRENDEVKQMIRDGTLRKRDSSSSSDRQSSSGGD